MQIELRPSGLPASWGGWAAPRRWMASEQQSSYSAGTWALSPSCCNSAQLHVCAGNRMKTSVNCPLSGLFQQSRKCGYHSPNLNPCHELCHHSFSYSFWLDRGDSVCRVSYIEDNQGCWKKWTILCLVTWLLSRWLWSATLSNDEWSNCIRDTLLKQRSIWKHDACSVCNSKGRSIVEWRK